MKIKTVAHLQDMEGECWNETVLPACASDSDIQNLVRMSKVIVHSIYKETVVLLGVIVEVDLDLKESALVAPPPELKLTSP